MSEVTVDTIKLSFTADTSNAIKGIDALIARLNSVKSASADISKAMGKVNSAVKTAEKSGAKVSSVASKAQSSAQTNPALTGTVKTPSTTVQDSEKISNAVQSAEESTKTFTDAIGANGEALSAQQVAMFGTIASAQSYDGVIRLVSGATKAAIKGIQMFINVIVRGTVAVAKFALNIGTLPFRKMASEVGGAIKKVTQFLAAIKRIVMYRAIRTMIKELTQGFKEGMTNLYYYSQMINSQFAKSLDLLATDALYVKNSLGAMAEPIVNAVAPAIDYLTDRFVELLNKINEVIAALTGASHWTKALKYPVAYAESTDNATKSAKKLRATILGFDEINRLDDNSSGSGGSGSAGMDYSKMFQSEEVSTQAKDWVKRLKEAWDNADFTDIGASIGQKLKDGLDNIPWEDIKARGEQFYKSLATLINGFIEVPGLGESIGHTIAEAINFAVNNIWTFFDNVHWDSVGEFFGEGINGFTDKFDVKKLGAAIARVINSAVTALHAFINKVRWKDVGKFISDGIDSFFNEINTAELANTISDGILGAIDMVVELLHETDFKQIGEKIGELIKGLDYISILGGLAAILLEAIKAALNTLAGLIASNPLVGTVVGMAIALKIGAFLAGTTVKNIIATNLGIAVTRASGSSAISGAGSILGKALGKAVVLAATAYIGYNLGNWIYHKTGGDSDGTEYGVGSFADFIMDDKKNGGLGLGKTLSKILPFAEGGTPETGSLFLARESGPELVANIGRKTQVANNDQILSSISAGVEVANESQNMLLKEQNDLLRRLLAKDTTVNAIVSTDSLVSGLSRKNRRDGKAVVPLGV